MIRSTACKPQGFIIRITTMSWPSLEETYGTRTTLQLHRWPPLSLTEDEQFSYKGAPRMDKIAIPDPLQSSLYSVRRQSIHRWRISPSQSGIVDLPTENQPNPLAGAAGNLNIIAAALRE